ncbi:MAG: hypothetical protein SVZ03_13850 [Spirochaetota bacterium]|nr:hypothetical protein [Spirochaetota bacterium]
MIKFIFINIFLLLLFQELVFSQFKPNIEYKIFSKQSGKSIDVCCHNDPKVAINRINNLYVTNAHDGKNQKFKIVHVINGYYGLARKRGHEVKQKKR